MTTRPRWNSIVIDVPESMVFGDKLKNTLTQTLNIAKTNHTPSIIIEPKNIQRPVIVSNGNLDTTRAAIPPEPRIRVRGTTITEEEKALKKINKAEYTRLRNENLLRIREEKKNIRLGRPKANKKEATILKNTVRGFIARKDRVNREKNIVDFAAAQQIQRIARGRITRRNLAQEAQAAQAAQEAQAAQQIQAQAAQQIQRITRGRITRRNLAQEAQAQEAQTQTQAAQQIQRIARGGIGRKKTRQLKATQKLQSALRGNIARQDLINKRKASQPLNEIPNPPPPPPAPMSNIVQNFKPLKTELSEKFKEREGKKQEEELKKQEEELKKAIERENKIKRGKKILQKNKPRIMKLKDIVSSKQFQDRTERMVRMDNMKKEIMATGIINDIIDNTMNIVDEKEKETQAAQKIQRIARGGIGRKKTRQLKAKKKLNNAALIIQSQYRILKAQRKTDDLVAQKAGGIIYKFYKKNKLRKQRNEAVKTIQAALRRKKIKIEPVVEQAVEQVVEQVIEPEIKQEIEQIEPVEPVVEPVEPVGRIEVDVDPIFDSEEDFLINLNDKRKQENDNNLSTYDSLNDIYKEIVKNFNKETITDVLKIYREKLTFYKGDKYGNLYSDIKRISALNEKNLKSGKIAKIDFKILLNTKAIQYFIDPVFEYYMNKNKKNVEKTIYDILYGLYYLQTYKTDIETEIRPTDEMLKLIYKRLRIDKNKKLFKKYYESLKK